jgi:hypothetical protein
MLLRDTITGLDASWNSGIAFLHLQEAGGAANNGQLIRSLDQAYGIIRDGHTVDVAPLIGQEIYYHMTSYGVLDFFVPVDRITDEELAEIEAFIVDD